MLLGLCGRPRLINGTQAPRNRLGLELLHGGISAAVVDLNLQIEALGVVRGDALAV